MSAKKIPKVLREYLAKLAKKGGRARAKQYSAKDFKKWGKKGGRPPNRRKQRKNARKP